MLLQPCEGIEDGTLPSVWITSQSNGEAHIRGMLTLTLEEGSGGGARAITALT